MGIVRFCGCRVPIVLNTVSGGDVSQAAGQIAEVAKSGWSKLVDKGKATSKGLGLASAINDAYAILNNPDFSPLEKAIALVKRGLPISLPGPDLRPVEDLDALAVIVDPGSGIRVVIPKYWIPDP